MTLIRLRCPNGHEKTIYDTNTQLNLYVCSVCEQPFIEWCKLKIPRWVEGLLFILLAPYLFLQRLLD